MAISFDDTFFFLQVITLRYRLITAAQETDVVTKVIFSGLAWTLFLFFFIWIIVYYFIYTITNFCPLQAYKHRAKEIGFDEYHAFLRAVSFDFAQAKPEAEMQSALITLVTEDDSRVDR